MRSTLSRWALGFLIWTVLALLSLSQAAVWINSQGRPVDWSWLVPARFVDWYSCAVFTPLFFWLARRWPLDREGWARHLPLHMFAAAVVTVLKFALERGVMVQLLGFEFPDLRRMLAGSFISENIALWCVIAVVHAIEFHHRATERQVLTARLSARLSAAQLDALAARLHPHFLFNTLQGISTLVYRDPKGADTMLGHLSTLLRRTLQRGPGHEVTLAEELALLDEYLAIQQLRFGDRLNLTREVAEDVLPGLVPHFLLQPLVENAIEHGIARRAGAGHIGIRATRRDGSLTISVTDDGPGLTDEPGTAREGVGLGSTRQRLFELYGERATLALVPGISSGMSATLALPYHEEPLPLAVESA